jgi:hypothetical protein
MEIRTYEVFCVDFSRVIQSFSLRQAVEIFEREEPDQMVIFAEDVEYAAEKAVRKVIGPPLTDDEIDAYI